jgi:hypothetical protein
MKKHVFLFLVLCLITSVLFSQTYETQQQIISVEKTPEILKKLKVMNLDLVMERNNRIYINVSLKDIVSLNNNNIPYIFETQSQTSVYNKGPLTQSSVNGDFHTYLELEQDLFALEEAYPHITKVYDIGDSIENRNIYAIKISDNVQSEEDEAEVIFTGCHHAREWISVEVPYLIAKHLAENYDSDPDIKALIDHCAVWIIPLVNPDGLEYSIHFYRYWRKNRRDNGTGYYGVDPNRNYGYMWGYDNEGSSPDSYSNTYRGSAPFSEPETEAVRLLFEQHHFQALISYHSYGQIIIFPWGYTNIPAEQDALMREMADTMSELMEPVNGRKYETGSGSDSLYLVNGSTTDWALGQYGIPSFTIELPPVDQSLGAFFNGEEEIQPIFRENLPAALYLIDWCIQNRETDSPDDLRRKKVNKGTGIKVKKRDSVSPLN